MTFSDHTCLRLLRRIQRRYPTAETVFRFGSLELPFVRVADPDRVLDEVAADLPKAQVDKVVEIGRPADTIVSMAEKLGADHIVVGARGLNPGGKWLLGSVSDRVVQHAGRPVTVVH